MIAASAIALAATAPANAGAPPIKTQQCSVSPLLPADFALNDRLYVANRSNIITGYTALLANPQGYLTGAPDMTLGGTNTQLSLVSKNYLAGMVRDGSRRLYVAGPNVNTVTVYAPPKTGQNNSPPIGSLSSGDGLSQPAGLALDAGNSVLYVANNGRTANWYSVTIYDIGLDGRPAAAAKHIGGDKTGLCNPASVAVDPTSHHLYVANRESSGGSITVYNLKADGSLQVPAGAPADFNVQPATMMLHDTLNQLGAPVGLVVGTA
jgi:DNA-binding beta-propeller fold protein YncE